MRRRDFLKCGAYGLAAQSLLNSSVMAADKRKPNVLYVLVDQWRAQATGYAGDPNVKTPNLDRLEKQSVNFENAVSVCPVCTPYRAALMTGRYPLSTGMFMNDLYLPEEENCIGEIFKAAGYETGYIGKWHLDGHGRAAYIPQERRQGFDYWKVLECTHDYNNSYYYAGNDLKIRKWDGYDAYAQTKDAQNYIRKHAKADKPFLLVISYGGPHFPHATAPTKLKAQYPPESLKLRPNVSERYKARARKELQGYYAHCTALDNCVADLLDTLKKSGVSDNTILVFTSDHGEMMGSQDQPPCQKQRPWDESIRVPFLIRCPALGADGGRKVKAPVNTPDILPTLLALSGIPVPRTVEGDDLSALVCGKTDDPERAALVMNVSPFGRGNEGLACRGIRTARYTYVRNLEGPWLFYDNQEDPYQMKNLVDNPDYAKLQKELDKKLQAALKKTGGGFLPPAEHLKEWGYEVDRGGAIGYRYDPKGTNKGKIKVQSPVRKR